MTNDGITSQDDQSKIYSFRDESLPLENRILKDSMYIDY